MGFRMVYNFLTPDDLLGVKGQGQTLKTLKSNISKTVQDRRDVVYRSQIGSHIWGFRMVLKKFDIRWPLGVKGQGQTLKTLMLNISRTVRDREMVSIEVK